MTGNLFSKNNLCKSVFLSVLICVFIPVGAEGAILYLEPASGEYQPGDSFIAEIRLDTEGEEINTAQVNLTFPQSLLEVVDFSKGNSILVFWPEEPGFSNQEGTISLIGGIPGGYQGDGLLGRIVFRVVSRPVSRPVSRSFAEVVFQDDSQVLLNDGLGTPAELTIKGAVFTILAEKLEVPRDEWEEELKKDNIPPEPFEIFISQDPFLFEGKYFIAFSTIDKQTGIDYYRVKEGDRDWKRAESPYLLEDQSLRSVIKVKAVDKAGNERIAEYIPPRKITWKDVLPWIVLVLVVGGIIWYIITKLKRNIISVGLVFLFNVGLVMLPLVGWAQNASLYFSPSSGSFFVGSTFSVSIVLDTKGNEINAVEVDLKFPPDILQVTSPTAGESFISEWLTPPSYSNIGGTISFKGGVPGGIVTSAGLVSTITFRARSSGLARVDFLDSSKVLLNDGKGTPLFTQNFGGVYKILVPPPEGPKISSPTHLDSDKWCSDSNPQFFWEKEEGVTDFSFSFSQNPGEIPDTISEGDFTFKNYENVLDGIWYFHLRAKKDGVWGKTSHFPVKIDTTPPQKFEPRVEVNPGFVYFKTEDLHSGVDYYDISLVNLEEIPTLTSFFIESTSPFKIPNSPGKYSITIRAFDKAGNYQEVESRFSIISPNISFTWGKEIQIKRIFFPWWIIYLIASLILGGLGYLIFYLFRRKAGFKKGLKEIEEALVEIRKIEEREEETQRLREKFEEERKKLEEKLK